MCLAIGVDSATSLWKANVGDFRNEKLRVIATIREVGHDALGDDAVELVLKEAPVWAAFSGCVGAVAVVDEDFHSVFI